MKEYVIAVGVDYSDASVAALDLALEQTRLHPTARLIPVLVLAPASPKELMRSDGAFVVDARANLVQLVRSRQAKLPATTADTLSVEPCVAFGDPAKSLLEMTAESKADLLVVGTHGRSGLERVVLGSVAGSVVQGAGCPVLVARPPRQADEGARNTEPPKDVSVDVPHAGSSIISEPHLKDGAVVLYVIDSTSGRTFICSFRSLREVTVESLEREWVAVSSATERAGALRTAERYVQENLAEFQQLLDELHRRERVAQGGSSGR